ncbi:MAG: XRE family transcriptional regulator [Holdemanella biformis]|nr:XRE family transcriptional regulator [Holdemanella biformis]
MQHGYIILMKLQERNKKGRSIMKVNVKLLEEEMDKKHVSVSELARMSNVDKSTISRLLNEQRACSIATAQAVVQALDIPSKKAGLIFFSTEVA